VANLIAEAGAEQAANPVTIGQLRTEDSELNRYGKQQARKLGIGAKDVDPIIPEHRARRKA
jgi:broad specificity phosphatase PhoE